MESTVITSFRDKHTGVIYAPGEIFEGDAERVSELVKGGYVEVKPQKKVEEEPHGAEEVHAEPSPKARKRKKS